MPNTPNIKTICVFCGSRLGKQVGNQSGFATVAQNLGSELARAGFSIVYGGGRAGLMGIMAQAALAENGAVTGIIPRFLNKPNVRFDDISAIIETDTLRERIKLMADKSDAFIALPGGVGTLDELVQMLSMRCLGEHDKPIILIDHNGFWQPFIHMLEAMAAHGFIYPETMQKLTLKATVKDAVKEALADLSAQI